MLRTPSFEIIKEIIEQQLRQQQEGSETSGEAAVTISRATGCGALRVALELARELERCAPGGRAWAVLDHDLIQRVIEDPQLPKQLARYLPSESSAGSSGVAVGGLGTNPYAEPLPRSTTDTVRRLCRLGRIIIVDRAACLMAADLEQTLHVRMVGSFPRRVDRVVRELHMGRREAQSYVEESDAARARFLRERMGMSIENTLYYHLVVNTDRLSDEAVVQTISRGVELLSHASGPQRRHPTTTRPLRRGVAA